MNSSHLSERFGLALTLAAAVLATTGLVGTAAADGGDTPDSAVDLTGQPLPISVSGDTSDNTNFGDEACPFEGSVAPDEWYKFTPAADMNLVLDLCDSAYDTKIYIWDAPTDPGDPIACNDDACEDPAGNPYRSKVSAVLFSGVTYYIAIDGYGEEAGAYNLLIAPPIDCIIECDPEATPEGEPVCHEDYDDWFNYGCCCHWPPAFSPIECGETVCGTSGTYLVFGLNYRDSDWFMVVLDEPVASLVFSGIAEFPVLLMMLKENGEPAECDWDLTGAFATGGPCEGIALELTDVPAGAYYPWIGPSVFDGVACGVQYEVTLTCATDCPADVNGDDVVDVLDLLAVLAAWGDSDVPEDINDDGTVDILDLLAVLAAWGPC